MVKRAILSMCLWAAAFGAPEALAGVTRLTNGLSVIPVECRSGGVCGLHVALKLGAERVPRQRTGLLALTQQALLAHLNRELQERPNLAALRATRGEREIFAAQASWDDVEFLATATPQQLPRVLPFLASVVFGSELTQEDVAGARDLLENSKDPELGRDEAALSAYHLFRRALLGDSPLAEPLYGPRVQVGSLTLADVKAFYQSFYVPNLASVCLVAPMPAGEGFRQLKAAFGPLKSREPAKAPAVTLEVPDSRVEPGTVPGTEIAVVMLGVPLPPVGTDGYLMGLVLQAALAGPEGRLASDRRLAAVGGLAVRQGVSAQAVFDVVPVPVGRAPFLALLGRCAPRGLEAARQGMLGALWDLARKPLTDEELHRAKLRVINAHALAMNAPAEAATEINRYHLLGANYVGEAQLADRMMAFTAAGLQAFASDQFARYAIGVVLPEEP